MIKLLKFELGTYWVQVEPFTPAIERNLSCSLKSGNYSCSEPRKVNFFLAKSIRLQRLEGRTLERFSREIETKLNFFMAFRLVKDRTCFMIEFFLVFFLVLNSYSL